ncbi:MAG: glycine zipper 2TM domain-containing protein [Pseudomonadota bacterium]
MRSIKMHKVNVLVPALLTAAFSMSALADDQYTDTARVLSSTPQVERVNMPRQECRTEYQQQSYSNNGDRSIVGAVIGGLAGGLLGNTIGHGNGRVAAAAVGAGVGAIAGDRISNNRNSNTVVTRPVQSCYQVDNWQTVTSGYLVTYAYNGRVYSTVTNNPPGRYIDVNVAVAPGRYAAQQNNYVEPIAYDGRGWDDNRGDRGRHRGWDKRRDDDRYY